MAFCNSVTLGLYSINDKLYHVKIWQYDDGGIKNMEKIMVAGAVAGAIAAASTWLMAGGL